MEREEDSNLEEKKTGVQTETPEGETETGGYAREEKNFLTGNTEVETWSDGGKNSKKGFTGYVHFIWPYLLFITFVFFASLIAGYFSVASFPDMADNLIKGFDSSLGPLKGMSPISILFVIFLRNAFVSLLSLVLGLALGIISILIIAFNGYIVGVISNLIAQQKGLTFIVLGLLPHGIVELPMVFLSASIGLRLGHQVFSALVGRPTQIKREFKDGLKFYFRWIVPLLFVAAVIETFITPLILSLI